MGPFIFGIILTNQITPFCTCSVWLLSTCKYTCTGSVSQSSAWNQQGNIVLSWRRLPRIAILIPVEFTPVPSRTSHIQPSKWIHWMNAACLLDIPSQLHQKKGRQSGVTPQGFCSWIIPYTLIHVHLQLPPPLIWKLLATWGCSASYVNHITLYVLILSVRL